ncbi:MAG: glycosyl hydrolase [Chloroflexi bacterium]|nr:glycosyl hydrolase [Chloroflexota bacterium]
MVTDQATGTDSDLFETMEWRSIGPFRGGRVVAVAGHPTDPMVFYFGGCAGGVWKTYDGGTYWENVSDGYFKTAAVGAIAVAESDPNVIYTGMGESCIRGNVSHGDGVYRSTDAGRTWAHLGLEDTRHISRVRVDPRNPEVVFVAALGHVFGPNDQRGVFRSKDGGQTWERVLFKSEKAGAADLVMDPNNPRVLYAAIWEAGREPWRLTSGGPDSGLYKTVDGGDTWTELTNNKGLPEGVKGRMGLAVSPARSGRVWAIVESEQGGLFRSDDGGSTWELVNQDRPLLQRQFYFSHVFADPQDPETVYVLSIQAWKSTNGGRSFTRFDPPHGDHHDLWLDPGDPRRIIEGNDGGACVSFNGGSTWSSIYNQPTAQFYHVATDSQFPFRAYATQQDNSAISVPSRSLTGTIQWADCYPVGASESGHIAVRQDDPNIVYSGTPTHGAEYLLRYDHRLRRSRIISVWPDHNFGAGVGDHKYRFQWTYPIVISPHDQNILYVAANVVFRSENEGHSWEAISPDLTRNDPSKLESSGGPITQDNTGVEHYCTIFAFAESPQESGVFWAGSDDGLVHVSRDGGKSWKDVTPDGLSEWTLISTIEPSPHDPATAYMAATRYKLDDFRPYLYKTEDYGRTWVTITDGIPGDDFTRVIREDPERRGLLYAGTETGVYVSFDGGVAWQPLQMNLSTGSGRGLPAVPVHDLVVKGDELVVATHGRSFWILDNLALLRQLEPAVIHEPVHLFAPAPAYLVPPPRAGTVSHSSRRELAASYVEQHPEIDTVPVHLDAGTNPPHGLVVTYRLGQPPPNAEVSLTFVDSTGGTIKTFSSEKGEEVAEPDDGKREPLVSAKAGMNRFVWDMKYPAASAVPGTAEPEYGLAGPLSLPGTYEVRLEVGGHAQSQSFELLSDPRITATRQDLEAQFALLVQIRDKLSETNEAVSQVRRIRSQVEQWVERVDGQDSRSALSRAADGLNVKLSAIESELMHTAITGRLDAIAYPARLNAKLSALAKVVAGADGRPTTQSYDVFDELSARVDGQLGELKEVVDSDLTAFTGLVGKLGVPAIKRA